MSEVSVCPLVNSPVVNCPLPLVNSPVMKCPVVNCPTFVEKDNSVIPEILAMSAQTTAALTRLKPIWSDSNINLSSKIRLIHPLVLSVLQYARKTWTLSADLQRKTQDMEMRCFQKILRISYKDHVTNEEVLNKIQQAIGLYEDFLETVRKLKARDHLASQKSSYKVPCEGEEQEEDRKRYGKTT